MLWALLRFVDPIAHHKRTEDLRRQREDWPPDVEPDETDVVLPSSAAPQRLKRCRVCEHEGPEPQFCPECLADTMI